MVLYSGKVVTVTASNQYSDLFHAMLGAGHSTFGVITRITVKTYPAPPTITNFFARYDLTTAMSTWVSNLTFWESVHPSVAMWTHSNMGEGTIDFDMTHSGSDVAKEMFDYKALPGFLGEQETKKFSSLAERAVNNYIGADNGNAMWMRAVTNSFFIPRSQSALDAFKDVILNDGSVPFFSICATVSHATPAHACAHGCTDGQACQGLHTAAYACRCVWHMPARRDPYRPMQAITLLLKHHCVQDTAPRIQSTGSVP